MGRAPCCEKMGLKKGPWTPEEDRILINYIRLHGHSNWRALPKQAGLLRCGKSCRLRWINYLRPDIKRGNFTPEEEDTIIKLHGLLGNRWSTIAAKLPGRTDNEIKNVWHTHLKKRINQSIINSNIIDDTKDKNSLSYKTSEVIHNKTHDQELHKEDGDAIDVAAAERPTSPQQSCTNSNADTISSTATTTLENVDDSNDNKDFTMIDESFWSDAAFIDESVTVYENVAEVEEEKRKREIWEPPLEVEGDDGIYKSDYSELYNDDVEFWFGLLTAAGVSGISDQIHP